MADGVQQVHISDNDHVSASVQQQPQRPATFRFLDLPVELQFIVLEKFYEDPWQITDVSRSKFRRDLLMQWVTYGVAGSFVTAENYEQYVERVSEKSKLPKLALAPLQVSYHFRDMALKAIRNTHTGQLAAHDFTSVPNFFDKGVETVVFNKWSTKDAEDDIFRPVSTDLIRLLTQRFCNLSRVSLGKRDLLDCHAPHLEEVASSSRLDRMLSRQLDGELCAAVKTDMFGEQEMPTSLIRNVKFDFTYIFSLWDHLVPRNVYERLPKHLRNAFVFCNFEVCRGRSDVKSIQYTHWDGIPGEVWGSIETCITEGHEMDALIRVVKAAYDAEEQIAAA